MSAKTAYHTHQRRDVLSYLESAPRTHITAADVCAHLQAQGKNIGTTTVYRQLERMVDEGLVNKYTIDGLSPACFEYVGAQGHVTDATCFHCKCDACGALIHLRCDELEAIGRHLETEHGFQLNPMRTVFYGLCDACRQKKGDA